MVRDKERTRGDQNSSGALLFLGYSEIFAPPKKNYVGATKNNTGETGKNSNIRGHTEFFGVWKMKGARLSGGLLQRGVTQV